MHTNSLLLFKNFGCSEITDSSQVIEIGPNGIPSDYQTLSSEMGISPSSWHYVDMFPSDKLTYQSIDEYSFPIRSESYDVVIAGQVIEHVRKPWLWIKELTRVVKVGGKIVIIAPISWPYHEAPIDCWRIYPEGLKALFDEAGLETIKIWAGSLEEYKNVERYIPGRSPGLWGDYTKIYQEGAKYGFPVERSYDTVGVAKRYR